MSRNQRSNANSQIAMDMSAPESGVVNGRRQNHVRWNQEARDAINAAPARDFERTPMENNLRNFRDMPIENNARNVPRAASSAHSVAGPSHLGMENGNGLGNLAHQVVRLSVGQGNEPEIDPAFGIRYMQNESAPGPEAGLNHRGAGPSHSGAAGQARPTVEPVPPAGQIGSIRVRSGLMSAPMPIAMVREHAIDLLMEPNAPRPLNHPSARQNPREMYQFMEMVPYDSIDPIPEDQNVPPAAHGGLVDNRQARRQQDVRPNLGAQVAEPEEREATIASVVQMNAQPKMPESQIERWCCTKLNVQKFSFVWSIKNFSFCSEDVGEVLKTPTFGSGTVEKVKWCLRMNPNGLNEECKEYVSLYLLLEQTFKAEIHATFKFSIINALRQETKAMQSQRLYRFVSGKDWGFRKFIKRDLLMDESNGLLEDDRLTILCEVSMFLNSENVVGQRIRLPFAVPKSKLEEDLASLYEKKTMSDVTLKSDDGQTFAAHKVILVSRSSVFFDLLDKHMRENPQEIIPIVPIEGIAGNVLDELLYFIYSGRARKLDEMADALLPASNKYGLEQLKVMCEESLSLSLTVENAAERLIQAEASAANNLKQFTLQFVVDNARHIVDTKGWLMMVPNHPHLANDAYQAFVGVKANHS